MFEDLMGELPSSNIETSADPLDRNDPFDKPPQRGSDDDDEWLYDILRSTVSPKSDDSHNRCNSGPDLSMDGDVLNLDGNDGLLVPQEEHSPSISIVNETTEFEKNQYSCEIEITNPNPQSSVVVEISSGFDNTLGSFVLDDSALPFTEPAVIAMIKKSPSPRKEGHFKDDGDVIVTKPFLDRKVKRLKFQTVDVINHGDVVKITVKAKKLGEKSVTQPRLVLDKEIPEEFKCGCFTFHLGSPFCVSSENATVDWTFIDDKFEATLRPVTPDNVEFEIGLWSTNFGKNCAAQLLFQLEREGKTNHQRYFIKTCAYLKRDLSSFTKLVNRNFANRYKYFEEGSVPEAEPRQKKMRLIQTVDPDQLTSLIDHRPSEDTIELMNLLKDDSQYANRKC